MIEGSNKRPVRGDRVVINLTESLMEEDNIVKGRFKGVIKKKEGKTFSSDDVKT